MFKLSSRKIPGHSTANVVRKAQRAKRKVLRMLIIVVVVFTLCWLPAHLIHLAKFYESDWFKSIIRKAPLLESIAFFLCHANSAINPCLYVTLNEKFKREFLNLMRYCFPCIKPKAEHFLLTTVASEAWDKLWNIELSRTHQDWPIFSISTRSAASTSLLIQVRCFFQNLPFR